MYEVYGFMILKVNILPCSFTSECKVGILDNCNFKTWDLFVYFLSATKLLSQVGHHLFSYCFWYVMTCFRDRNEFCYKNIDFSLRGRQLGPKVSTQQHIQLKYLWCRDLVQQLGHCLVNPHSLTECLVLLQSPDFCQCRVCVCCVCFSI